MNTKLTKYVSLASLVLTACTIYAVDAGLIGAADDYLSGITASEGGGTVTLSVNPADNDGYIEKLTVRSQAT